MPSQRAGTNPRCAAFLVSGVLDVREFVLTLCGKNANHDYNPEHFDRLVFSPRSPIIATAESAPLPTVAVELDAYETRGGRRCVVADLARYNVNNAWKAGLEWVGSSTPTPYSHQGRRIEMSANVRFAVSRFDAAARNPAATRSWLSREIAQGSSSPRTFRIRPKYRERIRTQTS